MAVLGSDSDTIVAMATALGEGAIGIVRVSGPDAISAVDKIFLPKNKKPLASIKTFSCSYGWIAKDKNMVDEVIVTLMRAPKSYTCEDVVEINSHGGTRAQSVILELVLNEGVRLAGPGEFTKRAFLNGRLDLAQAEAVLDVIRAKSDLALKSSLSQLSGELSRLLKDFKDSLIEIVSDIETHIDFSDEDITVENLSNIKMRIDGLKQRLDALIERGLKGKIIREGLKVVIFGKPNVGKSSLLNAILKQERAIVTSIAGTTRDTIEETVSIKGLAVCLVDTAGILEHRDEIEKEAINRTQKALEESDLVLFVLDGSLKLTEEDRSLGVKLDGKKAIAVINKCDMPQVTNRQELESFFSGTIVEVSSLTGKNIVGLEDIIWQSVFGKEPILTDVAFVTNVRHIEILERAVKALENSLDSFDKSLSFEFISVDLKKALEAFGELTGEVFSDDILDVIFSKFCIGK